VDVSEMQRKLSQWATENPGEQYRELYRARSQGSAPWQTYVMAFGGSRSASIFL